VPTVLVGDIDRGGVLAAMYGTLALLDAADQALVAGFVVNKFRGDLNLLCPGLETLHRRTGRPVLGVLPWLDDVVLDSEDSLAARRSLRGREGPGVLRVAVVALPRISNFTDLDPLDLEPGVEVEYVRTPRRLSGADVVVLPGTRATVADLAWLRERGLAAAVAAHAGRGGVVLGLCGGFQMLGTVVRDPLGVESPPGTVVPGLGLLDVETEFSDEKVLRRPTGAALGARADGYEIHHGRVSVRSGEPFLEGARRGAVFGTMWHGCLESDELREAWLAEAARLAGVEGFAPGRLGFEACRQAQIDALADAAEEHLPVDRLLELAVTGPPDLPVLRGGLG
jgi:adenosylcobyric acid synthase